MAEHYPTPIQATSHITFKSNYCTCVGLNHSENMLQKCAVYDIHVFSINIRGLSPGPIPKKRYHLVSFQYSITYYRLQCYMYMKRDNSQYMYMKRDNSQYMYMYMYMYIRELHL